MEQLAQIVFDELQELKKRFDAACKDRKDSLKKVNVAASRARRGRH